MRTLSLVVIFCITFFSASGQVFPSRISTPSPYSYGGPPQAVNPNGSLISLDTNLIRWSEEDVILLTKEQHLKGGIDFPYLDYGRAFQNENHLAIILLKDILERSEKIGSELHLVKLDNTELISDSIVLSYKGSLNIMGFTGDKTHYYIAYEKADRSSGRAMYVSKVDQNAKLVWEINLGRRSGGYKSNLLQLTPDGTIVLFANEYREVSFDLINPEGEHIARKLVPFLHDFSPKSFYFKPNGHLIAIGTYTNNEYRNKTTSSVIFELDTAYKVLRHRQIQSPYDDEAIEIISGEDGSCYFLTKSYDRSAPYDKPIYFMTIGRLNQDFQGGVIKNIQILDSGISLGLVQSPGEGIISYQLYFNKGISFILSKFNSKLELQNLSSASGEYGEPLQILRKGTDYYLVSSTRDTSKVTLLSIPK